MDADLDKCCELCGDYLNPEAPPPYEKLGQICDLCNLILVNPYKFTLDGRISTLKQIADYQYEKGRHDAFRNK